MPVKVKVVKSRIEYLTVHVDRPTWREFLNY